MRHRARVRGGYGWACSRLPSAASHVVSLRRGGGREHAAGERGGAVEGVERLCIVARAGILVGQQERERERVGPAGRAGAGAAAGVRSTSGSRPSATGRAVAR